MRGLNRPVLLAVALVGAALLGACGDGDTQAETEAATPAVGFATREVEAGAVTAKITPQRIDDQGARFAVVLDTHSVELDLDVAAGARLVVDGTAWTDATWSGAEPGGHHREGTLEFTASGEPNDVAELTIDGLDEPVRATWDLEDR